MLFERLFWPPPTWVAAVCTDFPSAFSVAPVHCLNVPARVFLDVGPACAFLKLGSEKSFAEDSECPVSEPLYRQCLQECLACGNFFT